MAKSWSKEKYNNNDRNGGIDIAEELINNIREQDRADVLATGNDEVFSICASLQYGQDSYIYRGENNELLAIMGISRYVPEAAGRCVYMVGTNALNDMSYYKQLLVTEARKIVGEWVKEYGIIFNAVNEKNEKSIRWLTRLGAVWLPEKIETENGVFIQFVITERSFKECVA